MYQRFAKLFFIIGALLVLIFPASADELNPSTTMVVQSGCYIYQAPKAVTANRAGYISFGQEVAVCANDDTWATIDYNGETCYVLTKNLSYPSKTVIKNRVLVSPGPYPCSSTSALSYVFYGTNVQVLDSAYSSKGVEYVCCLIDAVKDSGGNIVREEQFIGYINAAYLEESSVPMVISRGTSLYATAFSKSSSDDEKTPVGYITMGEEVELLIKNKTWSKIRYGGKSYYVSTNCVEPVTLQIMVNRAMQTVDAKPGSGYQHYAYWNSEITVLNTYESDTYGTYYYCKIGGDYGFIRQYSSSGLQYVGHNTTSYINTATQLYAIASDEAHSLVTLTAGTPVTVEYTNDTWARVSFGGTTGYVLCSKLSNATALVNGKTYTTAYQLYKGKNGSKLSGQEVDILAWNNKYRYAYIRTGNGEERWCKLTSLDREYQYETVYTSRSSVTLHTNASNDSDVIKIPYMTKLTRTASYPSTGGAWENFLLDQVSYYVWVPDGETFFTTTPSDYEYGTDTVFQQRAVSLAVTIANDWDTEYAHGQSSGQPNEKGVYGFDCSGFASYVLNQAVTPEIPVYRLSSRISTLYNTDCIYNEGFPGAFSAETVCSGQLDKRVLLPGDILFFSIDEPLDHCGIYLGDGEFAHATATWNDVCIMPLDEFYTETFVCARRYLPDAFSPAEVLMYTTSGRTNVYAEKSSEDQPAGTLPRGSEVTLLYTDCGNWGYVRYDSDKYGYILLKYLTQQP